MNVVYVITWRYSDGSSSGAVSAHASKASAEAMLAILNDQDGIRQYVIETVPSEGT